MATDVATANNVNNNNGQQASIPSLQDFTCPVCLEPMIDLVESNCGHKFCKHCIKNWLRCQKGKKCPTCRAAIHKIDAKPELDTTIDNLLSKEMAPNQLTERLMIRQDRFAAEVPDPVDLFAVEPNEFDSDDEMEVGSNSSESDDPESDREESDSEVDMTVSEEEDTGDEDFLEDETEQEHSSSDEDMDDDDGFQGLNTRLRSLSSRIGRLARQF